MSVGPVVQAEVTPSNTGSFQKQWVPLVENGSETSEKAAECWGIELASPADKWKFE